MEKDVNLATGIKKQKRNFKNATVFSLAIFIGVFVVAVILVLYSAFLSARLAGLSDEANNLRSQISPFVRQKESLLLINERLASIRNILGTRPDIDAKIQSVLAVIPDSFVIEIFKADTKKISVSISSDNLSTFDSFLEEELPRTIQDNSLGVKSIELESFVQEQDGYLLSLKFIFSE